MLPARHPLHVRFPAPIPPVPKPRPVVGRLLAGVVIGLTLSACIAAPAAWSGWVEGVRAQEPLVLVSVVRSSVRKSQVDHDCVELHRICRGRARMEGIMPLR